MPDSDFNIENSIDAATAWIANRWPLRPRFGIVLGTGAGKIAQSIDSDVAIDYGDIPFFPTSTAMGHKGQLVCGSLMGHPVVAMRGRFHLYEGYPLDRATLPIHVMHRMGVEVLFVSNASGGINPKFASAEIMAISSHIDLMFRGSNHATVPQALGRAICTPEIYDSSLIQQAQQSGRKNGFVVHEGVYAAMLGPNYETRAEYRFLKRIGGDVVGMSTVPEVKVAARNGMKVLGLSVITNVANPDALDETSGQEVIDAAEIAAPNLHRIVCDIIESLSR